jgi:UDP-N-acetylmuramyl pentapeptide synthase
LNVNINYTVEQIAEIIDGKLVSRNLSVPHPAYLSLDSRKISFPETTLFLAIKNKHQNANLFLDNLYDRGVRNFITDDKELDIASLLGTRSASNIILVPDSIAALQKLAIYHRSQFIKNHLPVIGITGSNGKTIIKEWLYQLLGSEYSIVRSPKSFNSQIGVPLSVLNIQPENDLAIFEAGISKTNEMKNLEKIIQPTIGIFTNIGNAHDEGFKNRQQKISEKLILFRKATHLIFCADDKDLLKEIKLFKQKNKQLRLFSWGRSNDNILQIKKIKKGISASLIEAVHQRKKVNIEIPFTDDASVQNAIHCWCSLFILDKANEKILKRFNTLFPIEMRLEIRQGINH